MPDPKSSFAVQKAKTSCVILLATLALSLSNASSHAETIGLVMTSFHIAGDFTKDGKQECPQGLNPDSRDNFRAQYKTLDEQVAVIQKFGSTQMHFRGPNGEADNYSPEAVHDPLPYFDAIGTKSEGLNLDGTQDGQATDKTCKHGKFTNADGDAVDNQMFRVFGCVENLRPKGHFDEFIMMEIPQLLVNRWIIEVAGVDDRVNDDHVDVTVAHGLDDLVSDGNGGFVPGRSQRLDEGSLNFIRHTTGRIVNGVLITDPMPELRMTGSAITEVGERRYLDARFRLKLTPTGATGTLNGYSDVQGLFRFYAKTLGHHSFSSKVSMPSIYQSFLRNADGHKDPATGQCTAISGVYNMDFVNANIVRESKTEVADTISKGAGATR